MHFKIIYYEFVGNYCKVDKDNPTTKYYHSLICGDRVCDFDINAASGLQCSANNV